ITSDAPHPGVSVHCSAPSPQEGSEQTEEAGLEHRTLVVDVSSGQHFGALHPEAIVSAENSSVIGTSQSALFVSQRKQDAAFARPEVCTSVVDVNCEQRFGAFTIQPDV